MTTAVTYTSIPPAQGFDPDRQYRVWGVEHGLPFDALPAHIDGGPATVARDGWSVSTTFPAGDLQHKLSLFRGDFPNPERHPADGNLYSDRRDASRDAYEAGALGFMVYDHEAARWGLPTT